MRTSPVNVVDPADLADAERDQLRHVAEDAVTSGKIDLELLPEAVRAQFLFAVDAYARGESVAAVATGKPLTSNEAAQLSQSRTHLTRCARRPLELTLQRTSVPADEVMRI